mmetsp:Transcript_11904/g.32228  ORF Transcript_11904/g.32228 Transcript_11904/m.32228 type:complete len:98 (+) Transcript_11904:1249-1542(+)
MASHISTRHTQQYIVVFLSAANIPVRTERSQDLMGKNREKGGSVRSERHSSPSTPHPLVKCTLFFCKNKPERSASLFFITKQVRLKEEARGERGEME